MDSLTKRLPLIVDFGKRVINQMNFSRTICIPKQAIASLGLEPKDEVRIELVQDEDEEYLKLTPVQDEDEEDDEDDEDEEDDEDDEDEEDEK